MRSRSSVGVAVGVAVAVGVGVGACGGTAAQDVAMTTFGTLAGATDVNLDTANGPYSPSLVIDATGTAHVLYYEWRSPSTPAAARYGECPGGCDTLSSWSFATLPTTGIATSISRLELDSQGRPRFLITRHTSSGLAPNELLYAACDDSCTDASSWSLLPVGQAIDDLDGAGIPSAMPIALDDEDAVWVAFLSGTNTLTVASCKNACTDASAWSDTKYTTAALYYPQGLAIDGAGTLHITAGANAYSELTPGSLSPIVRTIDIPGAQTRMRLDSQGRPRILWGGPTGGLVYVSCDDACATSGTWSQAAIPVPEGSAEPGDLVLDSTDAPHVAYATPNAYRGDASTLVALGYAACDADCETASPRWKFQIIEPASAIWAETPTPDVKKGPADPAPLWVGPISLALDASGDARLLYEVSKTQYCPLPSGTPQFCATVLSYALP
jgi:hypothetical protein